MMRKDHLRSFGLLVALAALNGVVFGATDRIAALFSGRVPDSVLAVLNGIVPDVPLFLAVRLREFVLIASGAVALVWFTVSLARRLSPSPGTSLLRGLAVLVGCNVLCGLALETSLVWLGFSKIVEHRSAKFNAKRRLVRDPHHQEIGITLGSSQINALVDETRINPVFGDRAWFYDFHFEGAQPFDMSLVLDQIEEVDLQYALVHLSPVNLHQGTRASTFPELMNLRGLTRFWRTARTQIEPPHHIASVIAGYLLPPFHIRALVAELLFGEHVTSVPERRYLGELETDLLDRARRVAKGFVVDAHSEFNKEVFRKIARRLDEKGIRVLLLVGGSHPALQEAYDSSVKEDFAAYVAELQSEHASWHVINVNELEPLKGDDFRDLTHVTESTQERLIEPLVRRLRDLWFSGSQKPRVEDLSPAGNL